MFQVVIYNLVVKMHFSILIFLTLFNIIIDLIKFFEKILNFGYIIKEILIQLF